MRPMLFELIANGHDVTPFTRNEGMLTFLPFTSKCPCETS